MTFIDIQGVQKTRPGYIQKLFENCQEDVIIQEEKERLRQLGQCLLNARIFKEVKLEPTGPNAFLLKIEEKITFFPVPFASANNSGETKLGAFIVDFNAFGGRELFALGGFFSNRGYGLFGRFENKRLHLTKASMALTGSTGRQIYELRAPARVVDRLKEQRVFAQIDAGYQIGLFTPGILLAYIKNNYQNTTRPEIITTAKPLAGDVQPVPPLHERPPDSTITQTGGTLEFDSTNYHMTFEEGLKARMLAYSTQPLQKKGERSFSLAAKGTYGISTYSDHSASLFATFGRIDGKAGRETVFRLGGGRGFRGVEAQTVWADRYAALSGEYQIPFYTAGFGAVTTAVFAENGLVYMRALRTENEGNRRHWTAGIGAYVYFKGLAIPGLGIEAGHNSRYLTQFFSVTLGVGI